MWKPVKGYDKYEISDSGKVKNVRTGYILGKRLDRDGYDNVCLYGDGTKGCNKKVHRLVAEAFLLKEDGRDQINHKNGNKEDNRVSSLEWCTRSENTNHAYETGLIIANIRPAIAAHTKITDSDKSDILRLRHRGVPVKEIATMYGTSLNTIYVICKGGRENECCR